MTWHQGPLCGFDLETTGISSDDDRIVTACVARIDGSGRTRPAAKRWLVDPGVDIPEAATQIHGISTDQARAHGQAPAAAVYEIVDMLCRALDLGVPIVGYNIGYDLTLLDRETRRHGLPALADIPFALSPVIDAMVLDKHVDRYRKGSRKLVDVAKHYNVHLDDAHEASADAWAATGVACRIAARYPRIGRLSLAELHTLQVDAKREQDLSFAGYLRRKADDVTDDTERDQMLARADQVERDAGGWPIQPYQRQEVLG